MKLLNRFYLIAPPQKKTLKDRLTKMCPIFLGADRLITESVSTFFSGPEFFDTRLTPLVETPSNSAPRRRCEKPLKARQKLFGSKARQKLLRKHLSCFFSKINIEITRGQQRSKFNEIPYFFEMCHYLRNYFR